jgi:hypothetical protein
MPLAMSMSAPTGVDPLKLSNGGYSMSEHQTIFPALAMLAGGASPTRRAP